MTLKLPPRYEPVARLGQGGGGEVWAVRDRYNGQSFALKVLSEGANEPEMAALVREAVALSGLEGLGLPRVQRFGRLQGSGRPFLVREMVEGRSLLGLIDEGTDLDRVLDALARAAAQLTEVHRAGLFHGDVKPANIIVAPSGGATLVDLGLSAPWRDGGTTPEGLTPKYAAPELLEGKPLTVRAEVYALGATLAEALEKARGAAGQRAGWDELEQVAARATADEPERRHPSADEFGIALRRAARLPLPRSDDPTWLRWPIIGIDATAGRLLDAVRELEPGTTLVIAGELGSGRSVLVRRLAWSLGVEGRPLVWFDASVAAAPEAIAQELSAYDMMRGVVVLVDDAAEYSDTCAELIAAARAAGARLVVVDAVRFGADHRFLVPPLEKRAAGELVLRAVPSLTESMVERAYELSRGRPGELRRLVRRIAATPVASPMDITRAMAQSDHGDGELQVAPMTRIRDLVDRGRYRDAQPLLDALRERPLEAEIERARLELGLGDAAGALARLTALRERAEVTGWTSGDGELAEKRCRVYLARAHIGVAEYQVAADLLLEIAAESSWLGAEARAYLGLAYSYLGRHEDARRVLEHALAVARAAGIARSEAVVLSSLGVVLQRDDHLEEAREAYEAAIEAAERASEAGLLGTVQLNLAGVLKVGGDLARAIELFEAAVDMGRRSGRLSTVRNALLNLANADLYLGRLGRARASIEALEDQPEQLPPVVLAQLAGLKAELCARSAETQRALLLFQECAAAYAALGRGTDAAEARLEGVLVGSRAASPDVPYLRRELELARLELGEAPAHRPILLLAASRVAWLAGDEGEARRAIDEALSAAREGGQREWIWRALDARGELAELAGQTIAARRCREEALAVLEEIGARLPRDLREVYWNDARRRALRAAVMSHLGQAATEHLPLESLRPSVPSPPTRTAITALSSSEQHRSSEQRLARILEINKELAGEFDLDRLTGRITDHAVELLRAERGFVLLLADDGSLSVHTSRTRVGDQPHAEFSRSIARSVLAKGEPVVSLSAREDVRLAAFASVHEMALRSVACVPILAPGGAPIGALYVETRHRPGAQFQHELPTLQALANQVAIAIENARLISENQRRATDLEATNHRLEEAQARLKELLEGRTEQLKRARQKLRETRDTLYGHFGYQGLVGTSAAMRRIYSLIDRLKDTDVPVLITGESGTGKEVVARAIHDASPRAKRRFLGVNCGAIPDNLLESELFGHVRGAFTGADRERKGLFREAEGGTVLLDEIGEMPQKMQAGMLRVLQERRVRPVGGTTEEEVDLRLVFATHRDLEAMVQAGKFREDLFYRIHVVVVALPPLRERPEDIPQLVDHFLGRFSARYKRERGTVTRAALRRLMDYAWPGNVRQLEHVLLNAWVLSEEPELDAPDLSLPDGGGRSSSRPAPREDVPEASSPAAAAPVRGEGAAKPRGIEQHRSDERARIMDALRACNWNRVKAAELSGIPRRTFYRRLREYGIQ